MALEVDWFLRAHPEITMIEALLPDGNGVMRGKWLPRGKLHKVYQGELKFPKTALSLDIWGRDVEELVFATGDEDGVCRPIEGSLLPTPWSPRGRHGQLMLTMFRPDGAPYLGDARQVLKRVVARFNARGWRPVVAAELEFSLLRYDGNKRPCTAATAPSPGNPSAATSMASTSCSRTTACSSKSTAPARPRGCPSTAWSRNRRRRSTKSTCARGQPGARGTADPDDEAHHQGDRPAARPRGQLHAQALRGRGRERPARALLRARSRGHQYL
jgi:glutamine synthetase